MHAPIMQSAGGVRWTRCANCKTFQALDAHMLEGHVLSCNGCPEQLCLKKMTNAEWDKLESSIPFPVTPVMVSPNVNCYCRGAGCIYCTEADENTKALSVEWGRQCTMAPSKMPMWGSCSGDTVLTAREMTKQLQERGFLVRTNVGSQPRVADITGFAAGRRYEYDVERPPVGGGKTVAIFGTEVHQAMDASQRNEKLKQELIRQYTNAAAFKLGRISKRFVARNPTTANILKKDVKDQLAQNLVLIGCSYTEAGEIISELVEGLKNV